LWATAVMINAIWPFVHCYSALHNSLKSNIFSRVITWVFPPPNKGDKCLIRGPNLPTMLDCDAWCPDLKGFKGENCYVEGQDMAQKLHKCVSSCSMGTVQPKCNDSVCTLYLE